MPNLTFTLMTEMAKKALYYTHTFSYEVPYKITQHKSYRPSSPNTITTKINHSNIITHFYQSSSPH